MSPHAGSAPPPLEVRVVIVAAFEPDGGPVPGELSLWIERLGLGRRIDLPHGYRPLWAGEQGVIAVATGVGAARAAATLMALGTDPRFDLRRAWFLVTGVAGIDPARGSLASVVLPRLVVDGALAHEIDARELPADWPDGFVPIGKRTPYEQPRTQRFNGDDGIVFPVDQALAAWALALTRDTELQDTDAMRARRLGFLPVATAQRAPHVLAGDELASTTFWHGERLRARARAWVDYQTEGAGVYTLTAMEDSGLLQAITFLAQGGAIDRGRVLIVRAASNFDGPREGISAAESLAETQVASYSAYRPALENAYRVGARVLAAWLATWPGSPLG